MEGDVRGRLEAYRLTAFLHTHTHTRTHTHTHTQTAYLPQNKARVMAVLEGSLDVNEHRDPVTGLTLLLVSEAESSV